MSDPIHQTTVPTRQAAEALAREVVSSLPARVQDDGSVVDPAGYNASLHGLVAMDVAATLRAQAAEIERLRAAATEAPATRTVPADWICLPPMEKWSLGLRDAFMFGLYAYEAGKAMVPDDIMNRLVAAAADEATHEQVSKTETTIAGGPAC